MAKNKNRRRTGDQQPTEVRIPLGSFPIDAMERTLRLLGEPGVMPHSIDVEMVTKGMLPGTFSRVARGIDQCPEGHRDGIIVGIPRPHVPVAYGTAPGWIVLTCIDECEGRSVNLFFDAESLKQLVNRCAEVIAESERSMAGAVS